MTKFFKSVLFRIFVCVGVFYAISFINSCSVKAVNYETFEYTDPFYNTNFSYDIDLDTYPYYCVKNWYSGWSPVGNVDNSNKNNIYVEMSQQPFTIANNGYSIKNPGFSFVLYNYNFTNDTSNQQVKSSNWGYNDILNETIKEAYDLDRIRNQYYLIYCNYDIKYENGTDFPIEKYITESQLSSPVPEFISFNYTVKTNNNVVTGYSFEPEFSVFDDENYYYQYTYNDNLYLNLTENEQLINVNANGVLTIRIKDISTNEIVDSATFTINNVGQFYDSNIDYSIDIFGEYRTTNFDNGQAYSSSQSKIERYQIYVDFFPNSSILKYQVQYVNDGDSLTNNWTTLSSLNDTDYGDYTHIALENGTLYARILDSSDNILVVSSFTVDSIGKLAFDNNPSKLDNLFVSLSDKIDYGGPISSIISIPIELLGRFYEYTSLNTCVPYRIGSLFNTDFTLPCYDFSTSYADLYTKIDYIFCFILSIKLFRKIIDTYKKLKEMRDLE